MKKTLKRYIAAFLAGIAVVALVCFIRDAFPSVSSERTLRILCDGFFLASVFEIGLGLLVLCSIQGALDGLQFAIRTVLSRFSFIPIEYENYYTFKQRINSQPRPQFGFLIIVGLFFLLVAVILLLVRG